jgi:hypothetical protein
VILGQVKMGKFDHNNRMITLSVITLSGFHCSSNLWFKFARCSFLTPTTFGFCFVLFSEMNPFSEKPFDLSAKQLQEELF